MVGTILGWKVRHCGEVIKSHARELGVDPASLSLSVHRKIDAETQALVQNSNENAVVEGTVLDQVLHNITTVLIVRLTCEMSERERRYVERSQNRSDKSQLLIRDSADNSLRQLLYGTTSWQEDFAIVDTTYLTIGEVAKRIISLVEKSNI
jgi:cytidylate kinase